MDAAVAEAKLQKRAKRELTAQRLASARDRAARCRPAPAPVCAALHAFTRPATPRALA
jgi:hypothetical protein